VDRYFSYCRKSTDDEDHQILSIESQQQELKRYAEREKLQIVASRIEACSAKMPGRPIFNELLKRIGRGEANGILAWHPDRLARNALDGGQIIHLLDTGELVSLKFPTYTFENTPQGKFMLAIMFGQSKYYVDSLSENVRRGNRTKRESGWFPGLAPIGYLNSRSESGEKIIVPDPERFEIMKRSWTLFLSGAYSVPQILDIASDQMGLRTIKRRRLGGKQLSISGIYRVLINPFYAGLLVHEGRSYAGKHEPMVTMAQFEQVQRLLGRVDRARPQRHVFPYTGLMHCGTCGCSVTAENKINRFGSHYVYYHCTRKKRDIHCQEKCIEQAQIEEQTCDVLKSIYLDQKDLGDALAALEEERRKDHSAEEVLHASVEHALERCRRNLDNLTKLRYQELIGEEEFIRQRAGLTQEESKLNERVEQFKTENWIEPSRNLFLFSNRAVFWQTHGTIEEKRLVLSTVGSNLTVSNKKLSIDAKEPFQIIRQSIISRNWCAIVNDVRTFFRKNPELVIPLLPDPILADVD
jgi:site-specific DNA recombinase